MIVQQLREQEGFSPIECSIAAYFLEAGESLRDQSARSIAAKLFTAPSTVSRLCKRLGYSGYNEFREDYLDELRYLSSAFTEVDANQPFRKGDDVRTIAAKMGALYRETVADTLQLTDGEALEKAVELLAGARTIFVYSAGPQSYLAEDFVDVMGYTSWGPHRYHCRQHGRDGQALRLHLRGRGRRGQGQLPSHQEGFVCLVPEGVSHQRRLPGVTRDHSTYNGADAPRPFGREQHNGTEQQDRGHGF